MWGLREVKRFRGKLRDQARKGASSTTICYYYRTTYGPFKNFIRNHRRYFLFLCRTQIALRKNWEKVVDYINKAQYLIILLKLKRMRDGPLTNSDIARINDRFMHTFYCGLLNDIQTLAGKRNDLSLTKIYEMVEKMNQEFEEKYES